MKLQMIARASDKKSEAKRLRREGYIPAVLYSKGNEAKDIAVKSSEYLALIRELPPGRLSSKVVTLIDGQSKERKTIVKEVQYHVTSYDVLHLDFEELHEDVSVNVRVPIECIGVMDCVGVKLGGTVRQVIRKLKVRCLPKDIPAKFELNVQQLAMGGVKKLSDIAIPDSVRPLMNMNEVAVAIVKR